MVETDISKLEETIKRLEWKHDRAVSKYKETHDDWWEIAQIYEELIIDFKELLEERKCLIGKI